MKPKLWGELTPEERAPILMAWRCGLPIEIYLTYRGKNEWALIRKPEFNNASRYRIKPENEP